MLEQFKSVVDNRYRVIAENRQPDQPVIGWMCSYVPEEIIYAAGMYPVRVMGGSGDTTVADAYLFTNMCSFVRACLEEAFRGNYDFLDGFVTVNSCDHVRRLGDVWAQYRHKRLTHIIALPHTISEEAIAYFTGELRLFKAKLEEAFGVVISDAGLREAIALYDTTRRLLRQLYEKRQEDTPHISGAEFLDVVVAGTILPRPRYNEMLRELLSIIDSRPAISTEDRVRLLLAGSELDSSAYVKIIEDLGGLVVADDLCTGSKYFWNLTEPADDPVEALARRYLTRPECPRMRPATRRLEHLKAMIESHAVDAVILEVIKFCTLHGEDSVLVRNALKEIDVPLLVLNREYSLGGVGQMRTRVEAFFEKIWGV